MEPLPHPAFTTNLPNVPALRLAHVLVQGFTGNALPLRTVPQLGCVLR